MVITRKMGSTRCAKNNCSSKEWCAVSMEPRTRRRVIAVFTTRRTTSMRKDSATLLPKPTINKWLSSSYSRKMKAQTTTILPKSSIIRWTRTT